MQKVYTYLREGQSLMPEVLEGIVKQIPKCCLVPVVSDGGTIEENRCQNLNKIKNMCEDIMVVIDSDVILVDVNAIEMVVEELKGKEFDMVSLSTAGFPGHQIFAVWKEKFPIVKPITGNCEMCEVLRLLKFKCLDHEQQECERI